MAVPSFLANPDISVSEDKFPLSSVVHHVVLFQPWLAQDQIVREILYHVRMDDAMPPAYVELELGHLIYF